MAYTIKELLEIAKTQADPNERARTLGEIARLDKVEREKRSQDIIMVHNIHRDDSVVVWDRIGKNLRYLIPGRDKDVGEGKGNKSVPRYIASKFLDEIIKKIITETSEKEFAKLAKKYNGGYLAGYEYNNAIRTDNSALWEKYIPLVWLGVVSKFGEDVNFTEEKESILDLKKGKEDALNKLNLSDKKYTIKKDKLLEEVSNGDVETKTTSVI